jgi:hypothetical protein
MPATPTIKKLKVISPTAPLKPQVGPGLSVPENGDVKPKRATKDPKVRNPKAPKPPNTKQTPGAKAGAAPKTFLPKPVAGSAGFDAGAQSMPALNGPEEGFEG